MKTFLIIVLVLSSLAACGQLSDYDKAPESGVETSVGNISEGDRFEITTDSVMITGFFKVEDTGGKMLEMRQGDVISFTGWTVTFPTGLTGYEFEVSSISRRERDETYGSQPAPGDKLYLSEQEIENNLQPTGR